MKLCGSCRCFFQETPEEPHGHHRTQRLGDHRRKPDARTAHGSCQQQQRHGLERKSPAHGDGDSRLWPLHRRQEAAHEDVASQQYVAQAVPPQRAGRAAQQLRLFRAEEDPGDLGGEDHHTGEDHRRHDAHRRKAVPQQLLVARRVLLAVVVADKGLAALRNAQHGVDNQGVHVGDDGVAHKSVVAEAAEDDPVKQEDHYAVAKLRHAVGKAQRDQPLVDAPVHLELHDVEGVVSAQEVPQIDDARQKLGKARGEGCAPHAQVQHEDGDIVQYTVGQAAGDDRQNGQAGIAVGLDQHLHVIGDDEAQREGGQTPEIIDGILIRYALCTQQHGERLQKYEDEDSDGQADAGQQHDVLGEQAIGPLALVLSQIDGDDGAGTDGEDDADGEKHIGERHCQIHRRHGVLTDALGHHQPVHNGVQAENHEGCHRSGYEMQELR